MTDKTVETIVVIRLSALGDCLLLGPLFRGLRKRFSDARIVWVTRTENAVGWKTNRSGIEIIEWDDKKVSVSDIAFQLGKVDRVIDLQCRGKSKQLVRELNARETVLGTPPRIRRIIRLCLRINLMKQLPPVPIRYIETCAEWGVSYDGAGLGLPVSDKLLNEQKSKQQKRWIALAPGASFKTKCWPLENYIELARRLIARDFTIAWVGGDNEKKLIEALEAAKVGELAGQVISYHNDKFDSTVALIASCDGIVTNDSAMMHIAAGAGVKGVALFGSTVEEFGFAPLSDRIDVIQKKMFCRPCNAHGRDCCPLLHFHCMQKITVDEVETKLLEKLSR